MSNETFAERNPVWPLMNSTRSLVLGKVSGLFLISLIYIVGDTASQILRMLPKLEDLQRVDSPMSFDELSAVSKSLRSLTCLQGFDFGTAQVDISPFISSRLETVEFYTEKDSDLHFIVNVLENSIPHGQGFLKSLFLNNLRSSHPTTNSSVDYSLLSASLIKVIEVWFLLSNE
jgi:hypothetical protein